MSNGRTDKDEDQFRQRVAALLQNGGYIDVSELDPLESWLDVADRAIAAVREAERNG